MPLLAHQSIRSVHPSLVDQPHDKIGIADIRAVAAKANFVRTAAVQPEKPRCDAENVRCEPTLTDAAHSPNVRSVKS